MGVLGVLNYFSAGKSSYFIVWHIGKGFRNSCPHRSLLQGGLPLFLFMPIWTFPSTSPSISTKFLMGPWSYCLNAFSLFLRMALLLILSKASPISLPEWHFPHVPVTALVCDGHPGRQESYFISLCPYSAMDGFSAKHFIVTLKPNNIFQGKWLANNHHLWCRKIPPSLPGLNAFKETLERRSLYRQSDFFFYSPFVEISFTQGLKKKGKNKKKQQRKRKPALNEKFQSCLCKNPPSPSQRPLPLYPGLCVSRQRG